jgi:hypothetical protein
MVKLLFLWGCLARISFSGLTCGSDVVAWLMDSCGGGSYGCKRMLTLLGGISGLSSGLEHGGVPNVGIESRSSLSRTPGTNKGRDVKAQEMRGIVINSNN